MSAFIEITEDPSTWPPIQSGYVMTFQPAIKSVVGNTTAHFRPQIEYIYSQQTCIGLIGCWWRPLDKGDYPDGMMP